MAPESPTPTQTKDLHDGDAEEVVVAEDLIEEVSIDGMCGVY